MDYIGYNWVLKIDLMAGMLFMRGCFNQCQSTGRLTHRQFFRHARILTRTVGLEGCCNTLCKDILISIDMKAHRQFLKHFRTLLVIWYRALRNICILPSSLNRLYSCY